MAIEPVTRKERILSGEDIEPVTRLEYFLKNSGGGGGGGVFPVEILIEDGQARSSKTLSEIISAANSGLLPYLFVDTGASISIFPCINISAVDGAMFGSTVASINNNGGILMINAQVITINADGSVTNAAGAKTF